MEKIIENLNSNKGLIRRICIKEKNSYNSTIEEDISLTKRSEHYSLAQCKSKPR